MKRTRKTETKRLQLACLCTFVAVYTILSLISGLELSHMCVILTTTALRVKMLIAFGVAVTLPLYLAFVRAYKSPWLRILEVIPAAILGLLFWITAPSLRTPEQMADLSVILFCDVISSILLYIFEKMLPGQYKID